MCISCTHAGQCLDCGDPSYMVNVDGKTCVYFPPDCSVLDPTDY